MINIRIVIILACLSLFGCGQSKLSDDDPTTFVSADDKLMNQAITEARQTVDEFIHKLQNPANDESDFSIKIPIKENGSVEHFWLVNISYVDGVFSGTINNDPEIIHTVKNGQTYKAKKEEISDWLYMKSDKMIGNKTLHALFPHMKPKEVKAIKAKLKWD
jgi:uncharacterized protein YegJ (DUF2314 family)